MKRFRIGALIVISLASLIWSCMEELDNVDKIGGASFEPILEFPLINSDFTIRDFLIKGKSKARIVDKNGVMTLVYDDSISTPPAESYIIIPDQNVPAVTITGADFTLPPGASVSVNRSQTFNFNSGQAGAIDSILLKGGTLQFSLQSTIQARVDLVITIESLIRPNRSTFSQSFTFNGPSSQSPSVDLAGFIGDLTNNGTTTNTLRFSLAVTITSTGQPVTSAQRLTCSLDLQNIAFRGLFGNVASQTIAMDGDSVNVDIFDNAEGDGSFQLFNPSVQLVVRNSYGFPVALDINTFAAFKPGVAPLNLSGPAVNSPLNPYSIGAPSYAQIGQSVSSTINFSATNSNIPALLSYLPRYLGYQFDVGLNPGNTGQKNFALDTSRLTIGVHVELPFDGTVSGFTLTKDYEFDGLGIDNVEESTIKVKTVNGSPVDVALQVYFTLDNGTVVDSLFTDPHIIHAASIGQNGFATTPSTFSTELKFDQAKVDRIDNATKLVLAAYMATANNGSTPVKFSADNEFQVAIGVKTKMKYKLE